MIRIAIVSLLSLLLVGCGQKDEATTSQVPEPAPTPVDAAVVAADPQTTEPVRPLYKTSVQAPAADAPVAEFSKVVEQYKGKQIPVDTDPATNELVYLPIELVDSEVQKTDNSELPYIGNVTLRVPNTAQNADTIYIFNVIYHYENGQWQYKSASEELQGGGQEKVFENPVFKPELLK